MDSGPTEHAVAPAELPRRAGRPGVGQESRSAGWRQRWPALRRLWAERPPGGRSLQAGDHVVAAVSWAVHRVVAASVPTGGLPSSARTGLAVGWPPTTARDEEAPAPLSDRVARGTAIGSATIALGSLGWNIAAWWRQGPVLKVSATCRGRSPEMKLSGRIWNIGRGEARVERAQFAWEVSTQAS